MFPQLLECHCRDYKLRCSRWPDYQFNFNLFAMKFLVILSLCLIDAAFGMWNFTAVSDECIELNQQRLDLRDCCEYPKLHFYRLYTSHCIDECIGSKDICCSQICIWRNAKVTFIDGSLNLDGMKKMLLGSVRHKDDWENIIHKVIDQCDAESKKLRVTFNGF